MKTTCEPMFSNGSEHMTWTAHNCDKCLKQSKYKEKTDTYTGFRCSIDRDINAQIIGLHEISQKSYDTVQNSECPYIQTERKLPKKRKIKNQLELEL